MIIARELTAKDHGKTKYNKKFCLIPRRTDNGEWVWLETVIITYEVARISNCPYFGYHYSWATKSVKRSKYEEPDVATSVPSEEKESEGVRMVTYCAGKSETTFPEPFRK